MSEGRGFAASTQDGSYPRPQLVREQWVSLDGRWGFRADSGNVGLAERWFRRGVVFDDSIVVPFPPESPASGIGENQPEVVWYRRMLAASDLGAYGGSDNSGSRNGGSRVILHFGAVDHSATVWVDGQLVVQHSGGQTSFSADITDALDQAVSAHEVVVRAFDPVEPELPRGKQDWQPDPHLVWYRRSTGIWRSVWLESVRPQHVTELHWTTDVASSTVTASVELAVAPEQGAVVSLVLAHHGVVLGDVAWHPLERRSTISVELPALRNAQAREAYLWSPEHPNLIDATVEVAVAGAVVDTCASYLGVRSTGVGSGSFLLNGVPYYVRSVLEQGWWDESNFTPPSDVALRAEVELIRSLGFNAVRVHQKTEDPRFLYWADRLGLLVWGEMAATYAFGPRAIAALVDDWQGIIEHYRDHPSIVTWVPVNESWGVQDLRERAQQRSLVAALAALTRAIDPTRPVISNDGWEHLDSDILSIHDYTTDPDSLRARYAGIEAVERMLRGPGPQLRSPVLAESQLERFTTGEVPIMVTEFGGISYASAGSWGYAEAADEATFSELVAGVFAALLASPIVAGFCYTQLTDTMQETNGLLRADRSPKLPVDVIRSIVGAPSAQNRLVGMPDPPP